MTDALTALIQGFEGCRLKVYDDATGKPLMVSDMLEGHPTIGWGRVLDTNGITQAEADYLLQNDIQGVKEGVLRELPWMASLDDTRQNILFTMAFQMGVGGLMDFQHMLTCVQAKSYQAASVAMLASLWAKQTPSRAHKLAEMMTSTPT